ncbi:MAG TPA: PAS domain S-box protein, partial [Candidatus Paceibacterota bacterium]|nr:PAS domain S-box protein [Candidatus Paceibacterota bacterium]
MNKRLHILHLEDEPDFAELVRSLLAQDGLDADVKRISSREELENALAAENFDLIISDYHLPSFNGTEALKIVRQKFPDLPFILVSGTIGEQAAIESLRAGATDYIIKQKPERLPSAIRRAIQEAGERAQLRKAEADLRASEKQYRLLFQDNPNPMWVFDLESLAFLEVNTAAIRHYGYSREEFLRMKISDIQEPEKKNRPENAVADVAGRGLVWRHRKKSGALVEAEVVWTPMAFQGRFAALTMATDVTERRHVEHRNSVFSKLSHRLSAASTAPEAAMIICEAADELFRWDDFALDTYDAGSDEVFSLLNITTVEGQRVQVPSSPQPKTANALIRRVIEKGAELLQPQEADSYSASTMLAPVRKGDRVIGVLLIQNHTPGVYAQDDLQMFQTLADQCSGALDRVQAREQLLESDKRFRDLFDNSPDAIFVEDMDGTVLDVNFAACVLHGLTRDQLIGKNAVKDLVPRSKQEEAQRDFQKLAGGKLSWVTGESLVADGRSTPVEVRAGRVEYGGKPALLLHVRDITERRTTETALQSSEMLFRSVWENSVDGMRLTDENGVIVAVNDAYSKFVEMEASAMEGKPFTIVYSKTSNLEEIMHRH